MEVSSRSIGVDDLINHQEFDGPQMSWFSPPGVNETGYGVAAIGTIKALQKQKVRVLFNADKPYCAVSFVQPEYYKFYDHQLTIGYTPWESTEIPDTWRYFMNRCGQVWTTSTFCKEVFEASGIEVPVTVVPHGIDPDVWSIEEREIGEKFRFLHVGGETGRKNPQMVIDAFLDLFDGQTNVELVMKSHGPGLARWRRDDFWGGRAGNHPQITCIEESFEDPNDVAALYHSCHALVYPTNGEGFGFIPFQGIATGMPTICTDATGCKDFAGMSMPLDSQVVPAYGIHLGDWVQPDEDHLRNLMIEVYEDYNTHRKKAMQSAKIIHSTQTWDHIATQIIDLLGDDLLRTV